MGFTYSLTLSLSLCPLSDDMLESTLKITFSTARKFWWQIGDVRFGRVDVFSSARSHLSSTVPAFSSLYGPFPWARLPSRSLTVLLRPHPISKRAAEGRAERSARVPNVPKRSATWLCLVWPFVYAGRSRIEACALFKAKCSGLRASLEGTERSGQMKYVWTLGMGTETFLQHFALGLSLKTCHFSLSGQENTINTAAE